VQAVATMVHHIKQASIALNVFSLSEAQALAAVAEMRTPRRPGS